MLLIAAMGTLGLTHVAMADCAAPAECPAEPTAGPVDDPAAAAALLVLANHERAGAGLPAVTPRLDVTEIAQGHSRAMAAGNTIWHNDDYFSAATKRQLGARAVGENVAVNNSIADAHARLMNSPGHRANIMDARFTVAGFAVTRNPDGRNFITEDFLQPVAEAAQPDPDPPARAPVRAPAAPPRPPASTVPAPAPAPAPAPPTTIPHVSPTTAPDPTGALTLGRGDSDATGARWDIRWGLLTHDDEGNHAEMGGQDVITLAVLILVGLMVGGTVIVRRIRQRGDYEAADD